MKKQRVKLVAKAGFAVVLLISHPTPRITQEREKWGKYRHDPMTNSPKPNEVWDSQCKMGP